MVDKEMAFVAVLVVLVLAAALQAYQLVTLNGKVAKLNEEIRSGQLAISTGGAAAGSGGGGSAKLPPSLENLPGMVGGC